jgi:hypothetical protein
VSHPCRWRRPEPLCEEAATALWVIEEYELFTLSKWAFVFWIELCAERGPEHAEKALDVVLDACAYCVAG